MLRSTDYFFEYLYSLEFLNKGDTLLLGDFNIPGYADFYYTHERQDNYINNLMNFLNLSGLNQYNFVKNTDERLLDLVIFNRTCTVSQSEVVITRTDKCHPALSISFHYNDIINLNRSIPKKKYDLYNFRKANFPVMYDMFLNIDWSFVERSRDVEECCADLYDKIYSVFNECVPRFGVSNRRIYPPWFNADIKRNIRLKAIQWRNYKRTGNRLAYDNFSELRRQVKIEIKNAYNNYIRQVENDVRLDPSKFWAFVGSRRGSADISRGMHLHNSVLTTADDIVNAFADFFSRSYLPSSNVPSVSPSMQTSASNLNIDIANFSETEVLNTLAAMSITRDALKYFPPGP